MYRTRTFYSIRGMSKNLIGAVANPIRSMGCAIDGRTHMQKRAPALFNSVCQGRNARLIPFLPKQVLGTSRPR